MTPCCTNCLHWDEDQADEDGYALCGSPGLENWIYEGTGLHSHTLYVRGDDGCRVNFTPKRAQIVPVVGEGTDKSSVQRDD